MINQLENTELIATMNVLIEQIMIQCDQDKESAINYLRRILNNFENA